MLVDRAIPRTWRWSCCTHLVWCLLCSVCSPSLSHSGELSSVRLWLQSQWHLAARAELGFQSCILFAWQSAGWNYCQIISIARWQLCSCSNIVLFISWFWFSLCLVLSFLFLAPSLSAILSLALYLISLDSALKMQRPVQPWSRLMQFAIVAESCTFRTSFLQPTADINLIGLLLARKKQMGIRSSPSSSHWVTSLKGTHPFNLKTLCKKGALRYTINLTLSLHIIWTLNG